MKKIQNKQTSIFTTFLTILFCFISGALQGQCTDCVYDDCGGPCESIMHDDLEREYIIHVPDSYDPATPMPLVFNFHGLGSDGAQQRIYSGMNAIANAEGFIVVYPYGVMGNLGAGCIRFWNVGFLEDQEPTVCEIDDVGFTAAMIDSLSAQYNIDETRVYACGMSMGGYMSHHLACSLEGRIAAIASVTGVLHESSANICQNERPMPVLQIHGTNDLTVPYDGVEGNPFNPSVEEVVDFWAEKNCCSNEPIVEEMPDIDTDDGCTATRFTYTDCGSDNEVIFYRINGGAHTWPGSIIEFDVTNQDIDASQLIWEFFEQYTTESGGYYDCLGVCNGDDVPGAICDDGDPTTEVVLDENCECGGVLISGCSDVNACNYNATATVDDGSCEYLDCEGECGGSALPGTLCDEGEEPGADFYWDENCVCGGDIIIIPGCTDFYACNYDATASVDDGSCNPVDCLGNCNGTETGPAIPGSACDDGDPSTNCTFTADCSCECFGILSGCNDVTACNYNPDVTEDDGSCNYPDCEGDCNGEETGPAMAGTACDDGDPITVGDAWTENCDCIGTVEGCTDDTACNYDATATEDDGSCEFLDCAGDCGGTALEGEACDDNDETTGEDTWTENCECQGLLLGCTDEAFDNYNPDALLDDGSCTDTALEAIGDGSLQISPNPFESNLQLTWDNLAVQEVIVYDISGKELLRQTIEKNTTQLNLSLTHFHQGIYFVQTMGEDWTNIQKVIKQ